MSTIKKDDPAAKHQDNTQEIEEAARHRAEDLSDDIVNEESDESFPCSDPPGWISEKPKKDKSKKDESNK